MTSLTLEAATASGAKPRDAERSQNFFALGLLSWMYNRPGLVQLGDDHHAGVGQRRQ